MPPAPDSPPPAVPFDDLAVPGEAAGPVDAPPPEVEFDDLAPSPACDHGHGHDDGHAEAAAPPVAPAGARAKPHHADPNYQTLKEMRDILAKVARKPYVDRIKIDSALGAARIAGEMIDLFGLDTEQVEDGVEAAAVAAGREAARRAVNTGLFGAQTPVAPPAWATPPGDPQPKRKGS